MNPTVFCNGSIFAIANPFPSSPIPSPMMCVLSMGFTQAEQKYQEDLHVAACTMGDHAIFTFFFCLKMGPTYGELLKVMEKFKRENRWVSFQTHDILGGCPIGQSLNLGSKPPRWVETELISSEWHSKDSKQTCIFAMSIFHPKLWRIISMMINDKCVK